jgi:NADP-dependent aldehyde dehydrogenase
MLNENISTGFTSGLEELTASPAVRQVATGRTSGEADRGVSATLLEVDISELSERMLEECFGPVTLLVRYPEVADLAEALASLPASLTSTVHTATAETVEPPLLRELQAKAGRVVYNGFPTGVAVSWAQNHGGGWPATNTQHTSVGVTSVRRFLRPLTWQNAPESDLPDELREATTSIPRRIDGLLVLPE